MAQSSSSKRSGATPNTHRISVHLAGRDSLEVDFSVSSDGAVTSASIASATGCREFLTAAKGLIASINEQKQWPKTLAGNEHSQILLREVLLRAQNRFALPYSEIELCHCRAVPTTVVDQAIIGGCQTTDLVARMTSAGTSCGTCKQDTEKLIAYRLKESLESLD